MEYPESLWQKCYKCTSKLNTFIHLTWEWNIMKPSWKKVWLKSEITALKFYIFNLEKRQSILTQTLTKSAVVLNKYFTVELFL